MKHPAVAAEKSPMQSALHIPLWLVWAAALGFVLSALGAYGILDDNEGLYAEIPREMLVSHDWHLWVIPHLNNLPYMEKPPLLYWLTAFSFSLFGISEWSARLVPALSSLACVVFILRFGQALQRPQAARLAALMFVSGVGVVVMSRTLMFDMLLTACLTAALMNAYLYAERKQAGLLRRAYAWLALALMAKGFVALALFGMVVGLMLLLGGRWQDRRRQASLQQESLLQTCRAWLEPWAVLIFLLIAAPWHIAASLVEPIFPWFFFINEQVLRFLGKREPHDYYAGGWWYYLPRMALYLFPWSFLLPTLLPKLLAMRTGDAQAEQGARHLRRFLLLAWLAPLVFFSASSAKANYYLVAVMPFAAFHLALALEERAFLNGSMRASVRLVPGMLIALIMAALCLLATQRAASLPSAPTICGWAPAQFAVVMFASLAVLALLSGIVAWRRPRIGVLAYLVLSVWAIAALGIAANAVEPLISTRQLAHVLQTELPERTVYLYREFEQHSSLPFYLQQPVGVINSRSSDLYWGNKLQPNAWLVNNQQFDQALSNGAVAVVVFPAQLHDFNTLPFVGRFKGQRQFGAATVFFN